MSFWRLFSKSHNFFLPDKPNILHRGILQVLHNPRCYQLEGSHHMLRQKHNCPGQIAKWNDSLIIIFLTMYQACVYVEASLRNWLVYKLNS